MKDENNAKKEIDPEIKAIGERIRAARKAKGLTMEKLAEAADTSTQFLSKVEKGEQSMTTWKFSKLVKALDVSSNYILYGHDKAVGPAGVAAEYMGRLNPIERDILARNIILLRGILDTLAPEDE